MTRCIVIAAAILAAACGRDSRRATTHEPRFHDAAAETDLMFEHQNGAQGKFHLPEIMGSGVALFDYDLDGDLDIYFVQGAPSAGGNRLYRNEIVPQGRLRFTDASTQTGTGFSAWGMGTAVGDYDGDGDPDLLVTNVGANVLYRNDGGRFTDVTHRSGVASDGWHTSATFVDFDRDGDLDVYIARYVDFSPTNARTCHGSGGGVDYCSPKAYRPVPDRLFRNEGAGQFVDVSLESGVGRIPGPGLGVVSGDFNGDEWPDFYIANDGDANHLWLNNTDGTFRNAGLETGVALSEDGMPKAGMGIAAGDYDNDGDEDLVVTNLTREGATLYRNEDNGYFVDASAQAGVLARTLSLTGFGTGFFDYDNDDCLDLFITNGAVTILDTQRGKHHPFKQRSQVLKGNCGSFEQVAAFEGDVGRGAAFGDVDNDGDVDIVVANNGGPARLILNDGRPNEWLRVRTAPGSKVLAMTGAGQRIRNVRGDGSYLSANDSAAHFSGSKISALEVTWPGGDRERFSAFEMNREFVPARGKGIRLGR
jgi:hypothetical protein